MPPRRRPNRRRFQNLLLTRSSHFTLSGLSYSTAFCIHSICSNPFNCILPPLSCARPVLHGSISPHSVLCQSVTPSSSYRSITSTSPPPPRSARVLRACVLVYAVALFVVPPPSAPVGGHVHLPALSALHLTVACKSRKRANFPRNVCVACRKCTVPLVHAANLPTLCCGRGSEEGGDADQTSLFSLSLARTTNKKHTPTWNKKAEFSESKWSGASKRCATVPRRRPHATVSERVLPLGETVLNEHLGAGKQLLHYCDLVAV